MANQVDPTVEVLVPHSFGGDSGLIGDPMLDPSRSDGSHPQSKHHSTHLLASNDMHKRNPSDRHLSSANGRNGSEFAHPQADFHPGMADLEAGGGYDTFPGENNPQLETLTPFDIASRVIYLLSLLFIDKKDRPPRHQLGTRHGIGINYLRSERASHFPRRMTAPVEELRVRAPGDNSGLGVMPSTNPGFFANAQNTVISGGTFSVVQQTIESDPAIQKSFQHIVYLLSIQTAILF
jgi:hypothetical protein